VPPPFPPVAAESREWRVGVADGIVYVEIKAGGFMGEAQARAVNSAIRSVAGPGPHRILCDISAPHEDSAGARRFGSSLEAREVSKAVALVVSSPVARVIGNAFLTIRPPPYPVRLFQSREEGLAWLLREEVS
jgi:hypothetical protein